MFQYMTQDVLKLLIATLLTLAFLAQFGIIFLSSFFTLKVDTAIRITDSAEGAILSGRRLIAVRTLTYARNMFVLVLMFACCISMIT